MAQTISLHELFLADPCVNLSCGQAGVPEHFLDGSDIGTIVQQVGRKAVPELVRRDVFHHRKLPCILFDYPGDAAC